MRYEYPDNAKLQVMSYKQMTDNRITACKCNYKGSWEFMTVKGNQLTNCSEVFCSKVDLGSRVFTSIELFYNYKNG